MTDSFGAPATLFTRRLAKKKVTLTRAGLVLSVAARSLLNAGLSLAHRAPSNLYYEKYKIVMRHEQGMIQGPTGRVHSSTRAHRMILRSERLLRDRENTIQTVVKTGHFPASVHRLSPICV